MSTFLSRGRFQPACRRPSLYAVWAIAVVLGLNSGCSALDLPGSPFSNPAAYQSSVGQPVDLQESKMAKCYQAVRQAKTQNSIVLEVVGDEEPFRVLPLPPGEKSVFVSHLLTQTGVIDKLGQVKATLYRNSEGSWSGLPMEIRMAAEGRKVRPESDYSLRPGDRLRVEKDDPSSMQTLIDFALAR